MNLLEKIFPNWDYSCAETQFTRLHNIGRVYSATNLRCEETKAWNCSNESQPGLRSNRKLVWNAPLMQYHLNSHIFCSHTG